MLKKPEKLITLAKLQPIVNRLKKQQKKVVWTNGCFDILHVGHVEYLERAKELGDILIVGLNSDLSIKALKGEKRPLFRELYRAKVLNAIEYIDYITIFNEQTPLKLLTLLQPAYYVKGGDYTIETIDQIERNAVKSYGGTIKIFPIVQGLSTSNIIKQIKNL